MEIIANRIRKAIISAVTGGASTTQAVSLIVLGEGGDIFSCNKPAFNREFRNLLAEGVIVRRNGGWAMPTFADFQTPGPCGNASGRCNHWPQHSA